MNLKQTIYLALAVVCLVIGIHQSIVTGILESYWILMLSVIFLLLFRMYKAKP
jgi:general stress protein CsbA